MDKYLIYNALAILLVLLIYLLIARERVKLFKKLTVFAVTVTAALLCFFSWKDTLGRANPFIDNGKYIVGSLYFDESENKVYVFVVGQEENDKFKPRLFVVPRDFFSQNNNEMADMLALTRNGGRLKMSVGKRARAKLGNTSYEQEGQIYQDDALRNFLPPKKKNDERIRVKADRNCHIVPSPEGPESRLS